MSSTLNAATLPLAGRHLIEASAGTGKTFNITRLYLRLLLERELGVEQILVMTFTRAATADLKGRIREQLTETLGTWDQPTDDPFFTGLHQALPAAQAKARLRLALLQLDEAAIYTIHGFCKRALTQQAFNSGISFHADMEADTRDLIRAAVEDWYRRCSTQPDFTELHAHWASPAAFLKDWADSIGHSEPLHAPAMPDMNATWRSLQAAWPLEAEAFYSLNVKPRRKPEIKAAAQSFLDGLSTMLQCEWTTTTAEAISALLTANDYLKDKKRAAMPALADLLDGLQLAVKASRAQWALRGIRYARGHVEAAKDRLDQLDFNDLVQRLRRQLQDVDAGPALAAALGQSYPAALVDEFQDTDTDQYAVLQAIYGQAQERGQLLCMIGDPKQAIYGFRGGDVFAYLQARDSADFRWQMEANYRSTEAVIMGYNRLFLGGPIGMPADCSVFGFGIEYHAVCAGKPDLQGLQDPRRAGDVWWCLLPFTEDIPGKADRKPSYTKAVMEPIGQWCAAEIVRLLTEIRLDGQALKPSDIALLVRDRNEATTLRDALRGANLESVYLSAQDNVLSSPEADSLYRALNGILHLEDSRLLVAALSTPWLGYDAHKLDKVQADEHAWARAADQLAEWRRIWQTQGFMKMALGLYQQHLHPEPKRHARTLTNALHLLELLQEASQRHRQPQALLHWFAQTRAELDPKVRNETQQMRLEADDDLIRIASLHGSKGLEYPVVFLPYVSYGKSSQSEPKVVRYHRRDDYNAVLALSPTKEELALHQEEQTAEDIRLLYVGATRAARRLYLVAAEFSSFKESPLAAGLGVDTWQGLETSVAAMVQEQTCAALQIDHIPIERLPDPVPHTASAPAAATFTGRIERDWWLSSFSALTRNLRHGGLSGRDRDGDAVLDSAAEMDRSGELRFRLKAGAEAGNLLHDVLEHLDFRQPDWDSAMDRAARRFTTMLGNEQTWQAELQQWIEQVLSTRLPSGARLQDLSPDYTLRESEFYFPMQSRAQRGALASVLAAHRQAAVPELPAPAQLKGMLHGFIDLVYHWQGRYYVVDYKSSHLGHRLANYRIPALTDNVRTNYYDLQYLLYSLALHRYLKTRLPDYRPAKHLGGVHYLYLRGMQPDSETGIYHRDADLTALQALDDYFRGRESAA